VNGQGNKTGGEEVGDGADLVDGVLGPGLRFGIGRQRCGGGVGVGLGVAGGVGGEAGLFGRAVAGGIGGLELGAQPADLDACFLGGAFGVEGDEAFGDGFVEGALGVVAGLAFGWLVIAVDDAQRGQQVAPAVGVEDGIVEFVVELAQDGDEALFV